MLWVGKELSPFYCKASRAGTNTVAARSVDNGEHWDIISKLPVPEGQDVSINPEKIKVTVKCAKNDAVAGKISATINAEDLNENDKTVKVTLGAEENIDIIGEYTVSAKLV